MRREVQPEILDRLPPDDPRAIQSRRDLRTVNAFMGHVGLVSRELRRCRPQSVVELGAGDGTLLLRAVRRAGRLDVPARAVLVDLHPSLSVETRTAFEALGWDVAVERADVFDWLSRPQRQPADLVLANLFLHHFGDADLSSLLALVSRHTRRFVACEPLRARTALAGASLLFLLGCNDVTRHDGKISVRAGFSGRELSALWPNETGWTLEESRAGLFTHYFAATRLQGFGSS